MATTGFVVGFFLVQGTLVNLVLSRQILFIQSRKFLQNSFSDCVIIYRKILISISNLMHLEDIFYSIVKLYCNFSTYHSSYTVRLGFNYYNSTLKQCFGETGWNLKTGRWAPCRALYIAMTWNENRGKHCIWHGQTWHGLLSSGKHLAYPPFLS